MSAGTFLSGSRPYPSAFANHIAIIRHLAARTEPPKVIMPVRPQAEWNLIMLLTNFGRNWYKTTKPYLWEYRDVAPGLVITGYLWYKITAAGYRSRRQKRLEGGASGGH
ncbi:uncharacterized protein [Branchiostoma lanceolatum]|uniref:uncharacterized protein isoform X2 n=1 Tax=Branchiostoma lanceolatum TaxID=7740 RepID=UPI0034533902